MQLTQHLLREISSDWWLREIETARDHPRVKEENWRDRKRKHSVICIYFSIISHWKQSCDVKFTSNSHRIRRKYEPGFMFYEKGFAPAILPVAAECAETHLVSLYKVQHQFKKTFFKCFSFSSALRTWVLSWQNVLLKEWFITKVW